MSAERLFAGAGETRALLRRHDWSATDLGPVEQWPPQLVAAVRTVLDSRVPMLIWWGPDLLQIYNDAYTPVLGDKHPGSLGQPARECWAEAWDVIGPMSEQVLAGEGAVYADRHFLFLNRHGYREETYWTFSYSRITDEDGVTCGIFVATSDVTGQVLGERRLLTLNELGSLSAARTGTPLDSCRDACAVLERNRADVPFALMHLAGADEGGGDLTAACGLRPGVAPEAPHRPDGAVPDVIRRVMASGTPEHLSDLTDLITSGVVLDPTPLDGGVPREAVALPLSASGRDRPVGVVVLGISPHRAFDEDYRSFTGLVGRQIDLILSDTLAYHAERRRAEALAELDAAKTRFFQNVSHEFRTPLTLVLGPLRDLLSADGPHLPEGRREGVEAALRAAVRLRRLVDNLLEISQADAGTLQPRRERTDLAALTADCASMFRSAIERDGLKLVVDVPDTPVEVAVDGEMWLKIVANLVSNAVKFTPQGTITVAVHRDGEDAVLTVADSGVGIDGADQQRIFERFQRAPAHTPGARSAEGTGIGLSLVRDLVHLHGGTVGVRSAPGAGSTFTVTLPVGDAAPVSAAAAAGIPRAGEILESFTSEMQLWRAPDAAATGTADLAGSAEGVPLGRLLLVEDNADMRAYLTRLLTGDGWQVDAVGDVDTALGRPGKPDLVLTDVMLPGRDGMSLLTAVRAHPELARIPVLLLTARAGAASAAEGLGAGADDYIVKPFDPDELLARIRVHHELNRLREYALAQAQNETANLQRALASNRTIGTAMGILMQQRKITGPQAFSLLRVTSQHLNRKLRDVADSVITTGLLPHGAHPGGTRPGAVR